MEGIKDIWGDGFPETNEDKQRCTWTLADLPKRQEEWKYKDEENTANTINNWE